MEPLIATEPTTVGGVAFDVLYQDHLHYVWTTLRRLGVVSADLEDVAHEVFVTVHRRRADFDAMRPIKPWIFGISLRAASRYRRTTSRRREVMGGELIETTDLSRRADGEVEKRDAQRVVFAALDRLSEPQRAVFVLHELEGKSVPEIAVELDLPLNTVYSRLRLARDRFSTTVARFQAKELAT